MQTVMKAYSIKDSKAGIYHPPQYHETHGVAEREFHRLTNDEKSSVNKYPEDFDLYCVGEYNTQTGVFKSVDTPQHIIKAADIKNRQ